MSRTSEKHQRAGPEWATEPLAIVWEPSTVPETTASLGVEPPRSDPLTVYTPWWQLATHTDHRGQDTFCAVSVVRRFVGCWFAALSRPTFSQLHGRSPMETTRIVTVSGSVAADVLDRVASIEWGRGRGACDLLLEPFHAAPDELGRPSVADAVLCGHRLRRLRVSVAIFDYGNQRCGIQIRPGYRRPWSSLRLRRCLRSTHGAADRLRELVLAVDFAPPRPLSPSTSRA